MKVDEIVPENDTMVKSALESEADQIHETEPFDKETDIEDSAAEQEIETKPSEINAKNETRKNIETECEANQMNVDECKTDELAEINTDGDESSENMKQDDIEVTNNDVRPSSENIKEGERNNTLSDKQSNSECEKSDSNSEIKFEMVKEGSESESRDSTEGSEHLKEDPLALPELREVHNGAEGSEICKTESEYKNEQEEPKVSDSKEQDSNTVQDITVSNAEHAAYDSNVVPEQYVIHESALLGSTDYAAKCESVSQDNNGFKDSESKTMAEASTEIGSMSDHEESKAEDEEEDAEDVQAALIAAAVAGSEGCCWDMVDSTEKFLAEVPVVALEAVPVPVPVVPVALAVVDESEPVEEVEVIPMKEELEVRLEEGTFPVAPEDALSMDWPYAVKMDSAIMAAALEETDDGSSSTIKSTGAQYPEYSTSQAVKLELEGECKLIL